jgi:hypothetical protein
MKKVLILTLTLLLDFHMIRSFEFVETDEQIVPQQEFRNEYEENEHNKEQVVPEQEFEDVLEEE